MTNGKQACESIGEKFSLIGILQILQLPNGIVLMFTF